MEQDYRKPMSAIPMLLGMVPSNYSAQFASHCSWEGITKVTLKATDMRCLLPPFTALACPRLETLRIVYNHDIGFDYMSEHALPLTTCSSLKHLEFVLDTDRKYSHAYDYVQPKLLRAYRSPAELHHHLPNIDTLAMAGPNTDLVEAFATQLTRLAVLKGSGTVQAIRQCSRLEELHIKELVLPDNPAPLKVVELYDSCFTDKEFKILLQLPNLTTMRFKGIKNLSTNIKHDWSGHACRWKELHVAQLGDVTTLANLNLNGLKNVCMGPNVKINLPDPSNPDSIAAVQRAADNLAHVGKIVLSQDRSNASSYFGQCGTIYWDVPDNGTDLPAAELLTIAVQRIGPVKTCNWDEILNRPLIQRAVIDWGHTFIETVCLGCGYDIQPHIWDTLRQLPRLTTVVMWPYREEYVEEHTCQATKTADAVCNAAQHYVIPANRRLRMEFNVYFPLEPGPHGCLGYFNSMEDRLRKLRAVQPFLQEAILASLPAGCKLVSVEMCYVKNYQYYSHYGGLCATSTFWVVVVEPLQPTT